MARTKQKARKAVNKQAEEKGNKKQSGLPERVLRSSGRRDFTSLPFDEPNNTGFRGFAQSAPSRFQPGSSLRNQTISFVSAGNTAPPPELLPRPPNSAFHEEADGDETVPGLDDSDLEDEDYMNVDDSNMQTNILGDEANSVAPSADMARMDIRSSAGSNHDDASTYVSSDVHFIGVERDTHSGRVEATSSAILPFVVDTVGDPRLVDSTQRKAKPPPKRAPSPVPSDSSEEVVLFRGRSKVTTVEPPVSHSSARGKARIVEDPVINPTNPSTLQWVSQQTPAVQTHHLKEPATQATFNRYPSASPHPTDDLMRALQAPADRPLVGWGAKRSKFDVSQQPESAWVPAPDQPYWKRKKEVPEPDLDAPALPASAFKQITDGTNGVTRKLGGTFGDGNDRLPLPQSSSKRGKKQRKRSNRRYAKEIIDSSDAESDGEAAYDDYMANLKAQLDAEDGDADLATLAGTGISARPLGLSTPSVKIEGQAPEDEDWEDSDGEGSFHGDLVEVSGSDSQDGSSNLEDELEYTEREQWEDEADLRQRRIDGMTDEHLARLFAKQEELGIEGDEIVIDDGAYVSMSEGVGDVEAARAGLTDLTNRSSRPTKPARGRKGKGRMSFPDASALADTIDQYGDEGFDIMDLDRPSLRTPKKGRKGELPGPLDYLSDEEMKATLLGHWEKTREKRRERRAEREALRADGLLGAAGRKGVANLGAKYANGMSFYDVKSELLAFLNDVRLQERAFPPMDKKDRAALHSICGHLGLKSKSEGSGKRRFPIVYKSGRTLQPGDARIARVLEDPPSGKVFRNSARGGKGKFGGGGGGRGGGFSKAAASLRHGDVVGAGAAEISAESMGHKLMEKMGWKSGMALGKDGEGRLVPVEQIMRTGTAGLG